MQRVVLAGLLAMALFVLSIDDARAGSIHVTKAEDQAARIRLYEHEVKLFEQDPAGFDRKYPTLGKILAGEHGFEEFLEERTFPRLLCVHTPFLWRVVDGDILYHRIHPWESRPNVPDVEPTFGGNTPDGNPPGGGGPADHNPGAPGSPGGPGETFHLNSVPEPSSWVIMGSGVTLALLAAIRRRIYQRLTRALVRK